MRYMASSSCSSHRRHTPSTVPEAAFGGVPCPGPHESGTSGCAQLTWTWGFLAMKKRHRVYLGKRRCVRAHVCVGAGGLVSTMQIGQRFWPHPPHQQRP
jgi:hypothetical protein